MADLVHIMSKLTDFEGNILIPGLMDLVAPLTEEEKKTYSTIDFCQEDYKSGISANGLLKKTKEETLMNRWRFPCLSLHGIEGAFSSFGAKTVIPSKVFDVYFKIKTKLRDIKGSRKFYSYLFFTLCYIIFPTPVFRKLTPKIKKHI